jgi:hypothetical protein
VLALIAVIGANGGKQSPGILQFGSYDSAAGTFTVLRDESIPDDAVFRVIFDELPPANAAGRFQSTFTEAF